MRVEVFYHQLPASRLARTHLPADAFLDCTFPFLAFHRSGKGYYFPDLADALHVLRQHMHRIHTPAAARRVLRQVYGLVHGQGKLVQMKASEGHS